MPVFIKPRKSKALIAPVFRQLGAFVEKKQRNYADWLSRKTEKYSRQTKIITLILFCVVGSAYWVWGIVKVFQKTQTTFRISEISIPTYSIPEIKSLPMLMLITDKEYADIQQFKSHIDSLRKTSEGQLIIDSILFKRPQLMDSITIIENIYLSQQKNK